ncbi:MAG TPA: flagellar biosynthetic protein FliO [Bryobacteraceae bacterium]|jgi:flagellar biogenesis protein FliO|nr:flagellar biosynthetic protein FliO [Bryobacteraceae bacterium]
MSIQILFAVDALNPSMGNWFDYLKTLLILGGISILALLAIKVGIPKMRRIASSPSANLQIVERHPLEPRKILYLVRTGKKMVLLATSNDAVHFMTTLDPIDFEESAPPPRTDRDNMSAFARIANTLKNRQTDRSL